MGCGWNPSGFWFQCFLGYLLLWGIRESWSLNDEGLVLLAFRERITYDPFDALANWDSEDNDPCNWFGVHCDDGDVQMLNLKELSLEGTLEPELGNLAHLKSLVLYKNHFSGTIPKELGCLSNLKLLDLRENRFTGYLPAEIGRMLSLRCLLLYGNKFDGRPAQEHENHRFVTKSFYENVASTSENGLGCVNRKFGHCLWQRNFKQFSKGDSLVFQIKGALMRYLNVLALPMFKHERGTHFGNGETCVNLPRSYEPYIVRNVYTLVNVGRRRLLEQPSNLAAAPVSSQPTPQIISLPMSWSSGSFPAVPKKEHLSPAPEPQPPAVSPPGSIEKQTFQQHSTEPSSNNSSGNYWKYIIIALCVALLFIVLLVILFLWQTRGAKPIRPWKTGISGQLQKAFVTGVPKLNRTELETACEDFSNIIDTIDGCTLYKGTLSSGVEIAVCTTSATSIKEWSKGMETDYHRKVDSLSRVNHKNFVNLIGFCVEEEPFTRMMVFEYAPNGTLFEHLHVKEVEHLVWSARMRIIMGTAYCLQYMHHDLNPPIAHSNVSSSNILLTDDYAAKVAEISFGNNASSSQSGEGGSRSSELPPLADPETNVYSFGVLLLEIISGKLPYSEEQGHLVNWAAQYINDKKSISYLIDPTLKSFKDDELNAICEVIQECIQSNARLRPTMKDITSKLREVLGITPDQATPRLSPLWWAELEILSAEAT